MTAPVLELQSLCIGFATDRGLVRAVQDVSFSVAAGQMLAIVGESGCGKSVTALAAMGLLANNARIDGRILFNGADAANAQRGRDLAMVFQEPMTSLNPAFTAGEQVAETLRVHPHSSAWAVFSGGTGTTSAMVLPGGIASTP